MKNHFSSRKLSWARPIDTISRSITSISANRTWCVQYFLSFLSKGFDLCSQFQHQRHWSILQFSTSSTVHDSTLAVVLTIPEHNSRLSEDRRSCKLRLLEPWHMEGWNLRRFVDGCDVRRSGRSIDFHDQLLLLYYIPICSWDTDLAVKDYLVMDLGLHYSILCSHKAR